MESLRFTRVRHLAQQETASLALTAYLPVSGEETTVSPLHLGKVREKAEKALAKHTDLKEVESFRTNLDYALAQVTEHNWSEGTWFIAVTPSVAEALFLPFLLEEDISVGKALKPYPALYALYRVKTVFIGVFSENTVRWFEGLGNRLFPLSIQPEVREALQQLQRARQQIQNVAVDTPQYGELFAQMARSAYSMALVKYTDTLRQVVAYYLDVEQVPAVLMGDERLLQEVGRGLEGHGSLTLIGGVPETASLEFIQQHVEQHLMHQRAVLEQMYYPFLAYSEAQKPEEIWSLLQDSLPSSPVLFIEEGYSFPAQVLTGAKRSLPTKDGVDLLVAAVREKGGEILFLPPGKLPHPLMLLMP
ncbi:MAG: hypothetical protein N2170_01220 [Bacteroidia bacterium]|nr:hypothetical protein [Bacteroidia bacterium]